MSDPTPLQKKTLVVVGGATAALGVAFAAAAVVLPDALGKLYALAASPGVAPELEPAGRFGAGVYGGLMAGWGVTLALLGRDVGLVRAAAAGLVSWWAVDSVASIAIGFPGNALSNTVALAAFTPVLVGALRRRGADRAAPGAAA
ncbi:MAG: hypothetical protein IT385_17865 [Deltaproteobacteria bacterium]|nr:hypothetical protein [Deltaproteobacteria bacterium]